MTITVTHPFVSAKPDGTDASLIQPSNWNDDHVVTGTVEVANGGTGASTATNARTNLGLGTLATQNANNVAITGGSVSGVAITSLDANTTFQDNVDPTKQMQFQLAGVTGGQTSILSVPDADGTLVLHDAAQTLTNKTISAANNTITTAATGNLAATTLNAALAELESEKAALATTVTKDSSTGAAQLPVGTTAQQPANASGLIRFNSTIGRFEGNNGSTWSSVGGGATGGGGDEVFVENGQVVTADYTIPAGRNANSVGPITINSGITVTVSSGSIWSVI